MGPVALFMLVIVPILFLTLPAMGLLPSRSPR